MSKRYSIMVVQHGAKGESELCQVDNDPLAIAQAAAEKTLRVKVRSRTAHVPKYDSVRMVDHDGDPRLRGDRPRSPSSFDGRDETDPRDLAARSDPLSLDAGDLLAVRRCSVPLPAG